MSWRLSACIEWLFADGGLPFTDRIAKAAASGFGEVEFWTLRDRSVDDLQAALDETGLSVAAFVSEPPGRLVDPATHGEFLSGVRRSCGAAQRLHARGLIVLSGDARQGVDRRAQRKALTDALRRAAPIAADHGIVLLLEPLNTRVDHAGYFLDSTAEGLDVVRDVDHPAVRLLYDVYHSAVMGEDTRTVLEEARGLIGHVHIADAPGRHEPGTGAIDWPRRLAELRESGYSGSLGLEYMPTASTDSSLSYFRALAAQRY